MDTEHSPWYPNTRRVKLPSFSVWRLLTWQAPQGLVAFVVVMAVMAAMVWGYVHSLPAVRIVVDGKLRQIRTNQTTVAAVLGDAGVTTFSQDRIVPPLDALVGEGDVIRVDHARPVTVEVDGQTFHVRSLKAAPTDILADLGVKLSPYDKLIVDGQPLEADAPHAAGQLALVSNRSGREASPAVPRNISVQRAVTLTVRTAGTPPAILHTTSSTVGEALREAGITLYLADRIQPDLSTPAQDDQVISIDRAVPVMVQVDGRHLHTRTHRRTVAEALAEVGVTLEGTDYTDPAPDAPLTPDMNIRVVRVTEAFRIEQEPVPFELKPMFDPDLEIDNSELRQAGENGVLQKRIRVRYEDGKQVSQQLEDSGIIRQPKHKVIAYGTKVVVRTLDTPDGPIEYWRKVRMLATSYTAATAGTPKTSAYYGRTRLGWTMRFGIVAVDPGVVLLGSQVYVPGYGKGDAGDTGSAIIGKRIDLGYDDGDPMAYHWYRWVDIYLLTPVPANIRYLLPEWPVEP